MRPGLSSMSTSAKIHEYNSFGVPCSTHPVSTLSSASKGERKPAKISVRQRCQFDDLAILLSLVVNVFELLPEHEKKQGISTDFSDSKFRLRLLLGAIALAHLGPGGFNCFGFIALSSLPLHRSRSTRDNTGHVRIGTVICPAGPCRVARGSWPSSDGTWGDWGTSRCHRNPSALLRT